MGWVIWVLTSNNYRLLQEPLLSRCPPIRLQQLTARDLAAFVRRDGMKRGLSETAIDAIIEALSHPSFAGQRPSLRVALRMMQRAADMEAVPPLH